jgi:hypothetical protein
LLHVLLQEDDVLTLQDKSHDPEWERLDVTVDSGSATSAIPQSVAPEWPLLRSSGPQAYTSASEHSVKVLGAKKPSVAFQNGLEYPVEFKVLIPLKKALLAVSKMLQSCRVVFDLEEHGGSYAEQRKTGAKFKIYERKGVFVLPMWIRRVPQVASLTQQWSEMLSKPGTVAFEDNGSKNQEAPFPGQASKKQP